MKRSYLAIILVTMVALSGCAMLDNSETGTDGETPGETDGTAGEFSQDVTFAWAGVAGESVGAEVTVENTGTEPGTHEATLSVDGESVASKSVTVPEGASETIALTHRFEKPDEYKLAVGESTETITVYESPNDLLAKDDLDRGTRVAHQQTNATGVANINGTDFDIQINESATIRTNYEEQTEYRKTETTTVLSGISSNETTEEWIVDGTAYTRTEDRGTGRVTYDQQPSDEFADEGGFWADSLQQSLSVNRVDDQYILTFDPETATEASETWSAIDDDENISAESITDLTMTFRFDATLLQPESLSFDATLEDYDVFSTLEMTSTEEIVSHDESVTVEVPDDVRENT